MGPCCGSTPVRGKINIPESKSKVEIDKNKLKTTID